MDNADFCRLCQIHVHMALSDNHATFKLNLTGRHFRRIETVWSR